MIHTQEQLESMSNIQLNLIAAGFKRVSILDKITNFTLVHKGAIDYCGSWKDADALIDGSNILVDGRGHAYSMNESMEGYVVTDTEPCRAATIVYILITQGEK